MKPYYECHITFMMPGGCAAPDTIRYLEKNTGWRFSQIDGDPVLGPGSKCYLTKHYPASTNTSHATAEADRAVQLMEKVARFVSSAELQVLRQKVELVLFDTKADSEIKQ
jgi:hypothetical protein